MSTPSNQENPEKAKSEDSPAAAAAAAADEKLVDSLSASGEATANGREARFAGEAKSGVAPGGAWQESWPFSPDQVVRLHALREAKGLIIDVHKGSAGLFSPTPSATPTPLGISANYVLDLRVLADYIIEGFPESAIPEEEDGE